MADKILKVFSLLLLISSSAIGQTIPASYFGMHENHAPAGATPYPTVAFGTFRIWDVDAVTWSDLEPSRGTYNWTATLDRIQTARSPSCEAIALSEVHPSWPPRPVAAGDECHLLIFLCASVRLSNRWSHIDRTVDASYYFCPLPQARQRKSDSSLGLRVNRYFLLWWHKSFGAQHHRGVHRPDL